MKEIKSIIWIDDDIHRFFLRPYIDELEENGFNIIKVEKADDVEDILQCESNDPLAAIIIDIAMPPGEKINFKGARGGLRTGKIILERLLVNENFKTIPKVIFTNVDDEEVEQYCVDNSIPYLKKEDYFSDEFVDIIKELINYK